MDCSKKLDLRRLFLKPLSRMVQTYTYLRKVCGRSSRSVAVRWSWSIHVYASLWCVPGCTWCRTTWAKRLKFLYNFLLGNSALCASFRPPPKTITSTPPSSSCLDGRRVSTYSILRGTKCNLIVYLYSKFARYNGNDHANTTAPLS